MSTARRFDEREIALIFEQASTAQDARGEQAGPSNGLTLEQLHEIGRDVGLSAEHISRAAAAVTRGDLVPTRERRWLGLPVGVSRTIDFGRPITDSEWSRLVVSLRETFDARGKTISDGPFRQWHNGNLQALLEPTEKGHRLRLSTRKGDAPARVVFAGAYLGLAGLFATLGAVGSVSAGGSTIGAVLFAGAGLAALASAVFGLPRWARVRARQMESIAELSATMLPTAQGNGNASVSTIPSSTS